MKNLSTRTKRLLAIAGVVIVVVLVGLVILVPGQEGLFGTTLIHISPENPTIIAGQTISLSINSVFACKWSSSLAGVVTIVSSADRSVTLKGTQPGKTTIKADCVENHYTTVTVLPPPTITPTRTPTPAPPTATPTITPNPLFSIYNPTLHLNQIVEFQVTASNCTFTSSGDTIARVVTDDNPPVRHYFLTAGSLQTGQVTITATCTGATGKLYVTVVP